MSYDAKMEIILAAKDMTERTLETFKGRIQAITSSVFSLQGGLVTLAGGYGLKQFIDSLDKSTESASDFHETFSKVQTLFGSREADKLRSWGKAAEASMGLSETAALDAVGTMGNMFQQLGSGNKEALNLSKGMVKLSADIASFHNVAGGSAAVLDAMQASFRGEYDALQRYIPTISAAAVQSQALADTHKKNAQQLTALEKAVAAYEIIMHDAGRAAGDFSRTSGGLANQERILDARMANLSKNIGQNLLPVKLEIVTATNDWIKSNEKLIQQKVPEYVDQAKTAAEGLFSTLKTGVAIYQGLPDEVVGAAGSGIIGRILFGSTPLGKIATLLLMTNQAMANLPEKFSGMDFSVQRLVKDWKDYDAAVGKIMQVVTGKRNWNTGNLQGQALDVFNLVNAGKLTQSQTPSDAEIANYLAAQRKKLNTAADYSLDQQSLSATGKPAYTIPKPTTGAGLEEAMMERARLGANYEKLDWNQLIPEWKRQVMAYDGAHLGGHGQTDMFMGLTDANRRAMQMMEDDQQAAYEKMLKDADWWSKSMSDAFSGWATTYSSKLNDMVWGSKVSFSDIGTSFAKMLTQMAIQSEMTDIGKSLFGSEGLLSSFLSNIGGRAAGGSVYPGQTVWVGENGPELLTMGRAGGYVTPNSRIGGGAIDVQVNVTNSTSIDIEKSNVRIVRPSQDKIIANLELKRKLSGRQWSE